MCSSDLAGVPLQIFGDGHGVGAMTSHAQLKRLHPSQRQKRIEGADRGSADFRDGGGLDQGYVVGGPDDGPADNVAMSVEVLGYAVQGDVRPQFEGELHGRRSERVVDDCLSKRPASGGGGDHGDRDFCGQQLRAG